MYTVSPESSIFAAPTSAATSGGGNMYFGGNPNLAAVIAGGEWKMPLLIGAGLVALYLYINRRR